MKREWKTKWVKALTSGKYKQGDGNLKHNERFCCLGVLRELGPKEQRTQVCENIEYLTGPQLAIYGLMHNEQKALGQLNDDQVPFEVIAGLINEAL